MKIAALIPRGLPHTLAWIVLASSLGARCDGAEGTGELPLIFNGKDLVGWKVPSPNPFWRVANGVLTGENDPQQTGAMLYTEKSYSNFVFETEVRWTGEIDSGVMFRKPELQLQIGISRSLKRDLTCSFYVGKEGYPEAGQAKGIEQLLKPGGWNRIRLQVIGATATVWLTGEKVSTYTNAKFAAPGPIGLQIHPKLAMKVEYRAIRCKALE
jgi:hypothetical protein